MKIRTQLFSFGLRIAFVYSLLYFFISHYNFYSDFVIWSTEHIFNFKEKLFTENTGSGDRIFDYFMIATSLFSAVAAGSVWAIIDRHKDRNKKILLWLILALRIAVGLVMVSYGISKIYPSQFPPPSLTRMMEIFGNTSPKRLLWTFMGSSSVYSMFGGVAELVGGIMLLLPYVWYLGALIITGVMANVFLLNISYDVPVKTFSFSLLLAAAVIVFSQGPKLFQFLVLGKTVKLELEPQYFNRKIFNVLLIVMQILILSWYARMTNLGAYYRTKVKPEVPLHGIWYVQTAKGVEMFPWTHLIFEIPKKAAVKFRDGHTEFIDIKEYVENNSLVLFNEPKHQESAFSISNASDKLIELKTVWEGHPLSLQLEKVDDSQFSLKSNEFHFINDNPSKK